MVTQISGVQVKIMMDSLSIEDVIGERSTCSFIVIDDVGVRYYQGQQVIVSETWSEGELWDDSSTWADDNILFTGYIDKPVEKKIPGTNRTLHTITCKDQHYLADKRIIAKAYENVSAGSIVSDLITEKLASEGVTTGTIQTGPTIVEAVFNYTTVTKALESLAEKADFVWYIDYDKKLYFMARNTITAPWTATGSDMKSGTVVVENGNSQYRNTQYVRGGRDITDVLTENKKGDGATRSWVLGFPCAKEPTIVLNGTPISAADVGIRGVESDKRYYWSKGSNAINQDESETLLTASDTLAITYQGEFDIIVKTLDESEIVNMEAIEGTTGIVEDVADENNSTTREAAFEIANAKLNKYGRTGRKLKFRTRRPGLYAGQLLSVYLPDHNINTDMLITSAMISTEENTWVWYDVCCVEGPEQLSWTKVFEIMATRGQTFVVRENISDDEILIILQTFSKTWQSTDSPVNIFTEVYASDTLYPSTSLYPMISPTDRVKYIELQDSLGNVLLRKQITKQSGTGVLNSITYVAPYEGVGSIASVAWFGGIVSTLENGSGIQVDEQSWARNKTILEALQIDKTDTRNFTPYTGTKALSEAYWTWIDDSITALEEASA